jgi:hypothetical protein
MHVQRVGCRWKDCPSECGPHKTIYAVFRSSAKKPATRVRAWRARLCSPWLLVMVTVVRPAWLVWRPMAWSSNGRLVMAMMIGVGYSAWIKVRNPASIAVPRERSNNWNK